MLRQVKKKVHFGNHRHSRRVRRFLRDDRILQSHHDSSNKRKKERLTNGLFEGTPVADTGPLPGNQSGWKNRPQSKRTTRESFSSARDESRSLRVGHDGPLRGRDGVTEIGGSRKRLKERSPGSHDVVCPPSALAHRCFVSVHPHTVCLFFSARP